MQIMFWIFNEFSWIIILFVFSLIVIISIGYFKFRDNSFESAQLSKYFSSTNTIGLVRKLSTKLKDKLNGSRLKNSIDTSNKLYSTFNKMNSFQRKQSFIKRSLAERDKKYQQYQNEQQQQHGSSFIYSSIFSFTKTLINRAPKQPQKQQQKPNVTETKLAKSFQSSNISLNNNNNKLMKNKLSVHNTISNLNTMSTLNENDDKTSDLTKTSSICKSVSLQIKDEMKTNRNRLLHQSSSGSSSHSSTPNDLFSIAEKGRIGARKHKPLLNHKIYQQQTTYTELVNQIQNHEDAINREYLLHQLNPSQYHGMHYYRRLERQNCLNKSDKKLLKQDTNQSNSSNNPENNLNELEHFTNSSSNSSCSECGSLDTEEELTIPFMKKAGHYQPNVNLRPKQPLKLSSSLDKNPNLMQLNNLTKQCSSDSNQEPMVGLLNENLIKRQLSNGTYLKLSDRINDNKLSDKRKRILGRRLTAQNSFSGSSFNNSFNNSSNNSSFDHDDMLVQFTSHQANSFSPDNSQFHHFNLYNHYENNSIHSNDTSSSSNSSCGHRHAERAKSLNLNNEFNVLNLCDNNETDLNDQQNDYLSISNQANNLHVTHAYDPTTKKLKIRIIKLDYVPNMKLNTDCDRYYIKLILLPNKKQKFKTTIKSLSLNETEFDELFTFNRIPPENILNLAIKYQLYSINNESKHHLISEAIVHFENRKPMQQEDNLMVQLNLESSINKSLSNYSNVINSNSLTNKSNTAKNDLSDSSSICRSDSPESRHSIQLNLPELLIGLAYNSTTGRLQVSIIRGSQFKTKSNSKPPDTYVKCTLLSSSGREIGRNKTSVKRSQPNPVYKQTFTFPEITLFQLPDVTLMISVYNKKSMNRKEMVGFFSLGCQSTGEEENAHWNDEKRKKFC